MQCSIQGFVREVFWVHGDIRTALFGGILQFCVGGSSLEDAQGLFQSCFRGYSPLVWSQAPLLIVPSCWGPGVLSREVPRCGRWCAFGETY